MKREYKIICLLILFALWVPGCASTQSINLTEEQEQQIVGYSADVLSRYINDKNDMLVDTTSARELAAKVEMIKERNKKGDVEESTETSEEGETEEVTEAEGTQDFAEALGVSGFEISYIGCEICKTYPNDGTTDDYFNMEATAGKELMVFHFDVTNHSETDMVCDILDNDPILRMIMNGSDRQNALTTLLLDDLATMNQVIKAGQTVGGVVVLEVPEGYEESVETVSFMIKCGENQSTIPIE